MVLLDAAKVGSRAQSSMIVVDELVPEGGVETSI